jgi:hypothetical protein
MNVNTLKTIGLAALAAGLMSLSAFGSSVTFGWDASSDPSVAGYRVYQGTTSGDYTSVVDAGTANQKTLSGLVAGTTYFFAVTSYTANGLESLASNEISYTPAAGSLATLQLKVQPNRQVILTATGPAAYSYDVLATQKFTNWTVIGTLTNGANGSGQFTDTAAPNYSSRSYRLRQTAP